MFGMLKTMLSSVVLRENPDHPGSIDHPHPAREGPRMFGMLKTMFSSVLVATRSRADLILEIAALRQQLDVYRRQLKRPKI